MADFDLRKFFRSWQMWLVALALLSLWCVPPLQLNQAGIDDTDKASRASLEDQYRRTLAQILGGLALLYGLYLTHRRIVATEENVRVAQEGQVTERFTRAIEQLGHQEMEIRLGGIYALERLAKDSEKDHSPIMEVLTAYVREKATKHGKYAKEAGKPTTDIQAILTVIGRRKPTDIKSLTDFLDLSDTHLAGADLSLANLSGVSLFEADLSGASLNGADLSGVNLNLADLSLASLDKANLSGAKLFGANLNNVIALNTVKNLAAEQVRSAKNCREEDLPDSLKDILKRSPDPRV